MFEAFYFQKPLFYSDHLIDKDDELNEFFVGINIRDPQIFMTNYSTLMKIKK